MQIGDRIRNVCYGTGTIIYKDDYGSYLVEFDRSNPEFHSGSGRGKDNHCWWCRGYQLKKENNEKSIKYYLSKRKGA